jgi:hypothetical protein
MSDSDNCIRALIDEYRAAPLPPLELSSIIKDLRDKDTSIQAFKQYYTCDPLLSSFIIDAGWNHSKNKQNPPYASDLALSSLGIDKTKRIFDKLKPTKTSAEAVAHSDEVKFLMSSAVLASELVLKLMGNSAKAKTLYWASYHHQFADILLWHLKPKSMWRIHYRELTLPKKLPLFEQVKLGFDLRQWRKAIANEWHMGELNQITYDKQTPFARKELLEYIDNGYNNKTPCLKGWHLTDSWLILTANWLAKAILANWLQNSYQHYFNIAATAYNVSHKKLNSCVQEAVRSASVSLNGSWLFVPAHQYLQQTSNTIYPIWLNAAPKRPVRRSAKFAKENKQLKQKSDLIAVEKFTLEIRKNPKRYRNTNVLLRQIMDLAVEKLHFSRATLLVVDWTNKKVSTAMFAKQKELERIKLEFDFSQNTPLKKFIVEQRFFVFEKFKHQKIWSKLPSEILRQKINTFVFFSFKPKQKIEYLLYIDTLDRSDISTEKLNTTKQLLSTANRVIQYNASKT